MGDLASVDAQLAELDDAAIEAGTDGTDGDRLDTSTGGEGGPS